MAIEDFTTYIEVDSGSSLTVTSSTITGSTVTRTEDALVYKDKGVNHFDGDFTHLIDLNTSSVASFALAVSWALTNDIDDLKALLDGNKDFIYIQHQVGTQYLLSERFSGSTFFDFATLTDGQTYYVTINRDESIIPHGQLSCFIYSDSGRTTLVDTLLLALHAKLDFRYVYGIMSFNDGNAGSTDITISNLNLQEAIEISGFPFFFDAGHY